VTIYNKTSQYAGIPANSRKPRTQRPRVLDDERRGVGRGVGRWLGVPGLLLRAPGWPVGGQRGGQRALAGPAGLRGLPGRPAGGQNKPNDIHNAQRDKPSIAVMCASRLLDVLAGRVDSKRVTGTILVNGQLPPKNFKFMTGYVCQVRDRSVMYGIIIIWPRDLRGT
jgi:hypothetical protein